ncbi:MAG: T9SS type A sorting domain-containing protein [Mangrovibacterium sp.]
MKRILFLFWSIFIFALSYGNDPKLKLDLNYSALNRDYTASGYTRWEVGSDSTIIVDGIKFKAENASKIGYLRSNWYKDGINAGNLLVCDGLKVDGADALGAKIRIVISGLTTGEHTLLLYLNNVDNLSAQGGPCPMDISVDGNLVVNDILPTMRALLSYDSQRAFLKIKATEGKDVIVLLEADVAAGGNMSNNNIYINAIELNTQNADDQAKTPSPVDQNHHVEAENNSINLSWIAGQDAVSHDVYFGIDSTAVANGEGLIANQISETKYNLSALNTHDIYYWRVDERKADGTKTDGNVWQFRLVQLAYPGAEGYGRFARGGRGGKVVRVTNLEDDVLSPSEGSLRYAIEVEEGPRTIVFDVSGLIQLKGRLSLSDDCITIAGQTAPGKGITVRDAPFGLSGADDAIVQHIRVRRGNQSDINWGGDGMGMSGCNNSIIDHASISWTIDEAFSSRNGNNVSLQRTLISEALSIANHPNYPEGTDHGYAATIGGNIGSFHHNLLANNSGRNWSLGGGLDGSGYYAGRLDIRNNVVYNWKSRATDGGAKEVNFVNNYYKVGAATTMFYSLSMDHEGTGNGTQQAFFDGNLLVDHSGASKAKIDSSSEGVEGRRYTIKNNAILNWETWVDAPFFESFVETQSAKAAYKDVLSDVGCYLPELDDHDKRIIEETLNGTYTYSGSVSGKPGLIDNEADAGGWEDYPEIHRASDWDSDADGMPNWWEEYHGEADGETINPDGYSNLEYYLQWMAELHYFASSRETLEIDLKSLFKGYTPYTPVYSVVSKENGEASIDGDVLKLKVAVVSADSQLARYIIKVTDSEGDSKERVINVFFTLGNSLVTIDYHLGINGAVNYNPTELTYATSLTLIPAQASGYRFMGWFADENYTQSVKSIDGTAESYELWARWKKIGDFVVYPSVTSQSLTLSSHEQSEQIQIVNAAGMVLKQFQTSAKETQIDVSDLPSGLYVLRSIKTNEQTRFVVK